MRWARVAWALALGFVLAGQPALTALADVDDPPPRPARRQATAQVYLPLAPMSPSVASTDLVAFTYRLREGDDLRLLALEWGVDSELMACVTRSGQEPLGGLRPGQVIMIPNPRYRCHTVQADETVDGVATAYGVAPALLVAEPWNALSAADDRLESGRRLLILDGARPDLASLRSAQPGPATTAPPQPTASPQPSAQRAAQSAPAPAVWPYGDGQFIWPVQGGVVSQGFHARHRAIDIAAPAGTPIRAADNGIVVSAGYSRIGYGGQVVIDHQIDYVTLYAHLSQALVQKGDVVQKGQIIGYVGSTGNSSGPHIHFELRDFGFLIDPRPLLSGDQ